MLAVQTWPAIAVGSANGALSILLSVSIKGSTVSSAKDNIGGILARGAAYTPWLRLNLTNVALLGVVPKLDAGRTVIVWFRST